MLDVLLSSDNNLTIVKLEEIVEILNKINDVAPLEKYVLIQSFKNGISISSQLAKLVFVFKNMSTKPVGKLMNGAKFSLTQLRNVLNKNENSNITQHHKYLCMEVKNNKTFEIIFWSDVDKTDYFTMRLHSNCEDEYDCRL